MKKFLKIFKRHPVSILFFAAMVICSIIYWNWAPIIFGFVLGGLHYLIWEACFIAMGFDEGFFALLDKIEKLCNKRKVS